MSKIEMHAVPSRVRVGGRLTEEADPWSWQEPSTPRQLLDSRAASVLLNGQKAESIGYFTCDNCTHAAKCVLAFDSYNTNGDCLASK